MVFQSRIDVPPEPDYLLAKGFLLHAYLLALPVQIFRKNVFGTWQTFFQSRVPAVYLSLAILAFLAFLAYRRICKLRCFNTEGGFDSHPRLQICLGFRIDHPA